MGANTMRTTAEVRWFCEGPLPEAVEDWFRTLPGDASEAPPRTDHYLQPAGDALGVKVRGGRVELKRREGGGEPVVLAPRVQGVLETWQKWSLSRTGDGAGPAEVAPPAWVAVHKQRLERLYRLDPAQGVVPCAPDAAPPEGCEVEVTRVEVEGSRWWSLCMEAYGAEAVRRDLVLRTAAFLFAAGAPTALGADRAAGYPAWLLRRGAAKP